MAKTAAVRAPARIVKPKPAPLFIKVSAKGQPLPKSAKHWAAVVCTAYRTRNGLPLMFMARDMGRHSYDQALLLPASCSFMGEKDWFLGDATESTFMLDRSKMPCLNPDFFIGEAGLQWTSTPYPASDSSYAYRVYLHHGIVYWNYRLNSGLVRLCREVPASQCSAFGL